MPAHLIGQIETNSQLATALRSVLLALLLVFYSQSIPIPNLTRELIIKQDQLISQHKYAYDYEQQATDYVDGSRVAVNTL